MANNAGLQRIGQIALTVKDRDRARTFYADVLGLRHLFDAPPSMSFFDCGGIRLMLSEGESGSTTGAPSSILYFDVQDIRAAHATLKAAGAEFEREPHFVADLGDRELWLAFFHDSEGNTLALMSEPLKPAG